MICLLTRFDGTDDNSSRRYRFTPKSTRDATTLRVNANIVNGAENAWS